MTRKDWTLLVIAAARGKALSPVQLQKTLFLIGANLSDDARRTKRFYNFRAYDYGPFAREIYDDAEQLSREGLVLVYPETGSYRNYIATSAGIQRADELRKDLSGDVVIYVDEVVKWAHSLSFNDLVRAIYQQYPEMKAQSVFRS
jgi:uncharacterized protein YwgA